MLQKTISVTTSRRGFYEITEQIQDLVSQSDTISGLCNIFIKHTSASIIICENADPDVLVDLQSYFQKLVKDGESYFHHTLEGADDMSAHIKSVLTGNSITIPITDSKLNIGIWQGVFLWEHRLIPHRREIILSIT
ncbi:MAG: YjbQ family protein [Gammaproteobacteria bacterium]|nr:MAG: YjbQ family protein [Gammaproteobacteria bacterium]